MIRTEEKQIADCATASPHLRTILIALTGGSKCKYIVKWAMEKFLPLGKVSFKLLHVFPKISGVPTPMGNLIPLPQVRDDVAAAYNKEIEWQKTEMIIQYQKMFRLKKVPAEIVLVETDDITNAITMVVAKHKVNDLVIGASSNSLFARKIKGRLLSSVISESAPSFCNVYVVSKGKLEFLRASISETNAKEIEYDSSVCDSTNSSSRYTNSTFDPGSTSSESSDLAFPTMETKHDDPFFTSKEANNKSDQDSTEFHSSRSINTRDLDEAWSFSSIGPSFSRTTSVSTTFVDTENWIPYRACTTTNSRYSETFKRSHQATSSSCSEQAKIELEIEKLRIQLRNLYGMHNMTPNGKGGANTTQEQSDLNMIQQNEEIKPKEMNGVAERFTNIMESDVVRWGEDRVDHTGQVVNTLERLINVADKVFDMASSIQIEPPIHFICPILQKVMDDPCVAADGFTYERKAIEKWLKDNDTSPKTDFPLPHNNLLSNYNLSYAICDWKSKRSPPKHHIHSASSRLI